MPIHEFRSGPGARILTVDGISDSAIAALQGMERSARRDYKQVIARFQRLVDYGPSARRPWFKRLEDAEDLRQLSYNQHRFLLIPHPRIERTFVLLSYFPKSASRTPPHEVRKGLRLKRECLPILESEETT